MRRKKDLSNERFQMKVLFLTDDDLTKSVVYDIHIMAEGLSHLGHDIFVVDCHWAQPAFFKTTEERMARVYPESKVRLFRYSMLTFPIFAESSSVFISKFLYAFLSCYRLAHKVIKENDIDVIVLYSVVNSGLSATHLGKKFKIPVVFRNIDMLYRLNTTPTIRKAVAFFEKKVYSRADKLLALTPKYGEYLVHMGGRESSVELLPFPVDVPDPGALPSRLGDKFPDACQRWLDEKREIIVFIGHMYNFSGLREFVRELPEVVKQVPDARLLLVGDGPIRSELETIVSELNLEEHVLITGLQPFNTMPKYISMAAVCINAYPISGDMKDLFAAKVIQYLACGKPTVSSALPGMTSMLPGESCGVVYVDDALAMAREVTLLLKSPERREQLGLVGLDYVREVHSQDRVVLQLERALIETIERAKVS
jgi:glycosyltransferase involved in cell wall biosynthesis